MLHALTLEKALKGRKSQPGACNTTATPADHLLANAAVGQMLTNKLTTNKLTTNKHDGSQ